MIINEQKVNETKKEIKTICDNLNRIDSQTALAICYNELYNFLKTCSSFSHMIISLANYKDMSEMLGNWTDSDEFVFENVKTIIRVCMRGTEEERLINAIEYLKY